MVNTTFSNNVGYGAAALVQTVRGLPVDCADTTLSKFAKEIHQTPALFLPLAPPGHLISPQDRAHVKDHSPVNVDIRGSIFTNNSAHFLGALVLETSLENIAVFNCSFRNNSVTTLSGGALASSGTFNSELYVSGCLFENNSAVEYGGAMYIRSVNTVVRVAGSLSYIWNSTFIDNRASSGGAVHVEGGPLRVENALMKGNRGSDGGAVTCLDCRHLMMKDVSLMNNTGGTRGGALRVTGPTVYSVNLTQVQAHGNK